MTEKEFSSQKPFHLLWEGNNTLELYQENMSFLVKPISNFPWSHPNSFVSICDKEGKELLLLESLDQLAESSREALLRALAERRFVLEVKSIQSVREEGDLRVWNVLTQEGERKFLTKLDQWPQALSDERVLITDVAGDIYEVKNLAQLDKRSQKLLWALVDWE